MTSQVKLAELVFDESLYPRRHVDPHNVATLVRAIEGGHELPPIVVCRSTKKIIDGMHRCHAARRTDATTIAAELRRYKDDAARLKDAVLLNSAHGMRLGESDALKVIAMGESLGLKDLDLAEILHTSVSHIEALKPRYAQLDRAYAAGGGRLQKIPLKGAVRHLSGETITVEQAKALSSAPGVTYTLLVRQLKDAVMFDLLPPPDRHPALWQELATLSELLSGVLSK